MSLLVSILGILYGTMTLELGGKITIECEKTKYVAELEFKLKVCVCLCVYFLSLHLFHVVQKHKYKIHRNILW